MYLLNIGLMTNDNEQVSLPWLRSALTLAKVIVRRSAVLQSRTEPTFVAELAAPLSFATLEKLARDLKQDCIAYYDSITTGGVLAGPKPWGKFDADQFILVSGGYLGDALRLARMSDEQFAEALSVERVNRAAIDEARAAVISKLPRGHYIGLDRPAWASPLEHGDVL